ncbi:hypothetical protein [Agromyces ramosus]|uniref:hypothetical protein n=1 Tax=Agromyces ramosus TaxID=33879 RepID=UPI0027D7A608|nr:hypothetical protein [Agromyces ramosus]
MTVELDEPVTPGEPPADSPIDAPAEAPRGRVWSRRVIWSWVAIGALLIAGVIAVLLMFDAANDRYDSAIGRYSAAAVEAEAQLEQLQQAEADATYTSDVAVGVLAAAADGYTDAAAKADLAVHGGELAAALESDPDLAETRIASPPRPESRPFWITDLDREAERWGAATVRVDASSAAFEQRTEALDAAEAGVVESGVVFMGTLPASAAAMDAATGSARNADRIELHAAIELIAAIGSSWNLDAVARVERYVAAATAAQASHAAEEAEKAGPLHDRRVAVEAFARSIAGGVLLEFDWAPEVNGYGFDGSYAGTATWTAADPGFSSITLTDSVAAMWPDNGVASLVAHEVGHAIVSKCYGEIISPASPEENEAWATAWAIGMGYTADGNGESIYGRPSDELIEKSKACR